MLFQQSVFAIGLAAVNALWGAMHGTAAFAAGRVSIRSTAR